MCWEAGKKTKPQHRPAAFPEPARSFSEYPPTVRRDNRIAGNSTRESLRASGVPAQLTTSSTRSPLSMSSKTFCEPDSTPIHTSEQPARLRAPRGFACQQIGASLNFERHGTIKLFNRKRKLLQANGDSIRKCRRRTTNVRPVGFLQQLHFVRDFQRRAQLIGVSKNRFCAPVAAEWTAPAGDQVQREKPVNLFPGIAIQRHIDQVARRQRKCCTSARRFARWLLKLCVALSVQVKLPEYSLLRRTIQRLRNRSSEYSASPSNTHSAPRSRNSAA